LERLPAASNAGEELSGYEAWVGDTWKNDALATIDIIDRYPRSERLLVVDHYGLDYRWETMLRSCVDKILIIDDLANRRHECDFLLDQNLYEDLESRYDGLVPENCRLFLGPAYALIRKEFREAKAKMKPRDGQVKRILIFMGGSDPTNETMKALKAVQMLERTDIAVDVVVGANHPFREEIQKKCLDTPTTNFYCQTDRMADLMAEADLAIGGGGTATWERCYMELPSLVVTVAKNQEQVAEYLHRIGAIGLLGAKEEITEKVITNVLDDYVTDSHLVIKMVTQCRAVGVGRDNLAAVLTLS